MTPPFEFKPTIDFFSEELQSHYLDGLHYTCRESDAALIPLCAQWFAEGKIVQITEKLSAISGTGG